MEDKKVHILLFFFFGTFHYSSSEKD